jgi:hypothetical protein
VFVTYAPADGDRQRWEWDPDLVRASEAELCEKRYSGTWDQFKAAVMGGETKARRVLLWHLLRRDHHTLRIEDVPDFAVGELRVEWSVNEIRVMRDRISKAKLDESEREQMLMALDVQMVDAIEVAEVGKAPSPPSGSGTGQPSRKRSASGRGSGTGSA